MRKNDGTQESIAEVFAREYVTLPNQKETTKVNIINCHNENIQWEFMPIEYGYLYVLLQGVYSEAIHSIASDYNDNGTVYHFRDGSELKTSNEHQINGRFNCYVIKA